MLLDFVAEYLQNAKAFAASCHSSSPQSSITDLARGMADSGYTLDTSFASAREFGFGVINDGLRVTLADQDGSLDPENVGRRMVRNYEALCLRPGVIGELACRPSRLGKRKVLVVHGTHDEAVRPC